MRAEALKMLPAAEQDFGRYRLLCRFATGGMANLYLARFVGEIGFEKLVAIKRIHEHLSDNAEFCEMLVDEARLCARLCHPNVVEVIELGSMDGFYFIVMEYVEGESLAALMRRTVPPLPVCTRIIADAAGGLHHAHQLCDSDGRALNVVHRDVSPQNILVSYDGEVKVVDFGVARARGNLHQTTAGVVKGKFAYMSPEQSCGEEVDRRTDVFALGIVLYEITTGHRLFRGQNDAETISKVRSLEVPRPSLLKPGYPPALEQIVMTALARDAGKRFQTAEELGDALEEHIVQEGRFVSRRNLRRTMKRLFSDRIAMKQELLARCEEADCILNAQIGMDSGPSLSLKGTASQANARLAAGARRTRRALLAVGGAAVALWIAALLLYLVLG